MPELLPAHALLQAFMLATCVVNRLILRPIADGSKPLGDQAQEGSRSCSKKIAESRLLTWESVHSLMS